MKLLCEQAERQEDRQTAEGNPDLEKITKQSLYSRCGHIRSESNCLRALFFFQCSKDIQYLKLGTLNLLPVV